MYTGLVAYTPSSRLLDCGTFMVPTLYVLSVGSKIIALVVLLLKYKRIVFSQQFLDLLVTAYIVSLSI